MILTALLLPFVVLYRICMIIFSYLVITVACLQNNLCLASRQTCHNLGSCM